MLTARELPSAEWWRLDGTELGTTWRVLPTDRARVVVVEDGNDQIVGTWAILPVLHADGLGVAPAYQKQGRVARLLLIEGAKVIRHLGETGFIGTAFSEDIVQYLERFGALEIPGRSFRVPLDGLLRRITKEN